MGQRTGLMRMMTLRNNPPGTSIASEFLLARTLRTLLRLVRNVLIERHAPNRRALEFLRTNLTAAQRVQFDSFGYFDVVGGETGHRYRIQHSPAVNVEEFDSTGRRVGRWCFSPQGTLPIGDVLLAQKIALELFEREARTIANSYPPSYPRRASDFVVGSPDRFVRRY